MAHKISLREAYGNLDAELVEMERWKKEKDD